MYLTKEEIDGLNTALNEAEFLGFEVDRDRRFATGSFSVLSLPKNGPTPNDRRVSIVFKPVGRVVASLRNAHWSDPSAAAIPLEIYSLMEAVTSFDDHSIYGWEFLDADIGDQSSWMNRLSLDWSSGDDGRAHTITLFQDQHDRALDIRVWFDCIELFDPTGNQIELEDFIEDGKRWWKAFYSGDEWTAGMGMYLPEG